MMMGMSLHKIPLLRQIQIRPRLFIAGGIGMAVALCLPTQWAARDVTRWIIGWNAGAWIYLLLAGWMMAHASHAQIQRRACQQDDGALAILALVVLAALASLGSIVAELSVAKEFTGAARTLHIALAGVTILSSWAFTQMMFALHYAHDFYVARRQGRSGGLQFPETPDPNYLDFFYFAAVIGTSGQTADVSMTSSSMRRVGLVHCVLAFLFNTSLVALTINVASSLL
ncbi:MAG: DUF1345 domain-containing protein [Aquabacterium sp.]|nr:MAG: DUF1345 domain-containing protein [Aquabacterium sp.]